MSPIGLAVVGAGYWGPNLVRAARVTPQSILDTGTYMLKRNGGRPA